MSSLLTLLEEEIFAEFDEFMEMTPDENSDSESDIENPPFEKITINTDYKIKTSLEEPPTDLDLKPLHDNLEYVFLEEPSFLPVIISSQLTKEKKNKLVSVLKKHKQAFAWKTINIPGLRMSWMNDGYCNGGNLPGTFIIENILHYQDYEWYVALEDSRLKDEALRNKAIMERFIKDDDDESNYEQMRRWDIYTNYDDTYKTNHDDNEREELCEVHEPPVCTIQRFEMIKYSFGQGEEYVAIKEDEYDDLAGTSNNACRTYQEIFRMMDEGWMDLVKEISTNIGGEFTNLEILKCWSLETSRRVLYKVEDIATCLVKYVKFWDDWEVDRYGNANLVSKRRAFWSLNEDILKITILKTNTPYPSRKIWRIRACTHQRPQRNKPNTPYLEKLNTPYSRYGINIIFWKISSVVPTPRNPQYVCMTKSSINKLFTTYKEPEREFRSSRRHFKTLSLDELRSPDFNPLSYLEYSEKEEAEAMAKTMEQYISKTRTDYGSGVAMPKIDNKDQFEMKGQFLKELRENTFNG
ncbi:hypothetical protein Tco_0645276 [Tanacetum coccineum]